MIAERVLHRLAEQDRIEVEAAVAAAPVKAQVARRVVLRRDSEIIACRHDRLAARLRAAGLGAIADLGFVGPDDSGPDADPAVITGYKAARNRPLTRGQKLSDKALAAVRAPVEHGFARLKNRRVLGKVRTDPKWAPRWCGPCWT
ncbi:hypothetical protein ACWGJB_37660 [Streptomyces sp. NPDC054813]